MGTTLTGTTPQDTYDSLIKVTDNGPLTGSLKKLTDGLGNDSSLSLSTGAASVTGTLAVSGASTFSSLTTVNIGAAGGNTFVVNKVTGGNIAFQANGVISGEIDCTAAGALQLSSASTYRAVVITSAGNVGIGPTAPAVKLDVVGNIRSSTGILFGTDTAAANALDDYEEGTWTMGVEFGGSSTGVTYSSNTGTYTKIGRQVTVNGYILLSSKGSDTGAASITGLPFTIGNSNNNFSAASIYFVEVTFANQHQSYGVKNTTKINLEETTEAGATTALTDANFSNSSQMVVSLTYFV
jgi:hypothetical protein